MVWWAFFQAFHVPLEARVCACACARTCAHRHSAQLGSETEDKP